MIKSTLLKPLLIMVVAFCSHYAIAIEEQFYSLTGDDSHSSVYISLWGENSSKVISDFKNVGVENPELAIETFFNLAMNNRLEELIGIHHQDDGSQDYIRRLLNAAPDAFAGAVNLKKITFKHEVYWGNSRYINFELENQKGEAVDWAETYVCENICLKSNADMFSTEEHRGLFLSIMNAGKALIEKPSYLDEYVKIELKQSESHSEYPVSIYISPKKIESEDQSLDWIKSFHEFSTLVTGDETQPESVERYLEESFEGWGDAKSFGFEFVGLKVQKPYVVERFSSLSSIASEYFVENKAFVWHVFSGYDSKLGITRQFIHIYDKELNRYVLNTHRDYSSTQINALIKNDLVRSAMLERKVDDARVAVSWPEVQDKSIPPYWLMIIVSIILIVVASVVVRKRKMST